MRIIGFLVSILFCQTVFSESLLLCGNDPGARELGNLILKSNLQRRAELMCDPLLSELAQEKAQEMAKYSMVSHTITVGANQRLKEGGFLIPSFYPLFWANNVEAISGGADTAEQAFLEFLESEGHRAHLMGEHPFYLGQTHIGVGHVRSKHSSHLDYWVVYITHHKSWQSDIPRYLATKD